MDMIEIIFLGVVFYVTYLIFKEVVAYSRFPLVYDIIVLIVIILLIMLQIYLTYRKEKFYSYDFYSDRIVFNGPRKKQLFYSKITNMEIKRPLLDQWFDCFTLVLNKKWKMRGIHNPQVIYDYIQKLRLYNSKKQP